MLGQGAVLAGFAAAYAYRQVRSQPDLRHLDLAAHPLCSDKVLPSVKQPFNVVGTEDAEWSANRGP